MTCHAIADLTRKHVDVSVILNLPHCLLLPPTFESAKLSSSAQEHGLLKACITWASHAIDIRFLNYIFETAGAEYLLVPEWKFKDQPPGWYSTVRRQKKLDARMLSLRLGRPYGALFPEDRKTNVRSSRCRSWRNHDNSIGESVSAEGLRHASSW